MVQQSVIFRCFEEDCKQKVKLFPGRVWEDKLVVYQLKRTHLYNIYLEPLPVEMEFILRPNVHDSLPPSGKSKYCKH